MGCYENVMSRAVRFLLKLAFNHYFLMIVLLVLVMKGPTMEFCRDLKALDQAESRRTAEILSSAKLTRNLKLQVDAAKQEFDFFTDRLHSIRDEDFKDDPITAALEFNPRSKTNRINAAGYVTMMEVSFCNVTNLQNQLLAQYDESDANLKKANEEIKKCQKRAVHSGVEFLMFFWGAYYLFSLFFDKLRDGLLEARFSRNPQGLIAVWLQIFGLRALDRMVNLTVPLARRFRSVPFLQRLSEGIGRLGLSYYQSNWRRRFLDDIGPHVSHWQALFHSGNFRPRAARWIFHIYEFFLDSRWGALALLLLSFLLLNLTLDEMGTRITDSDKQLLNFLAAAAIGVAGNVAANRLDLRHKKATTCRFWVPHMLNLLHEIRNNSNDALIRLQSLVEELWSANPSVVTELLLSESTRLQPSTPPAERDVITRRMEEISNYL